MVLQLPVLSPSWANPVRDAHNVRRKSLSERCSACVRRANMGLGKNKGNGNWRVTQTK